MTPVSDEYGLYWQFMWGKCHCPDKFRSLVCVYCVPGEYEWSYVSGYTIFITQYLLQENHSSVNF